MDKLTLYFGYINSFVNVIKKINTFGIDYNSYIKVFFYWAFATLLQSCSNLIKVLKFTIWIFKLLRPITTYFVQQIYLILKQMILFIYGIQFPIRKIILKSIKDLKEIKTKTIYYSDSISQENDSISQENDSISQKNDSLSTGPTNNLFYELFKSKHTI